MKEGRNIPAWLLDVTTLGNDSLFKSLEMMCRFSKITQFGSEQFSLFYQVVFKGTSSATRETLNGRQCHPRSDTCFHSSLSGYSVCRQWTAASYLPGSVVRKHSGTLI